MTLWTPCVDDTVIADGNINCYVVYGRMSFVRVNKLRMLSLVLRRKQVEDTVKYLRLEGVSRTTN